MNSFLRTLLGKMGCFLVGSFVLTLIFSFSFSSPSNSFFQVSDFLDHYLVIEKARSQLCQLFNLDAWVPNILGGVSLNTFNLNDLSFESLMYNFFDPYTAAALNEILSRSIGFVGFYFAYLSLTSHSKRNRLFGTISAVTFAMLPYWPSVSYAVASVPIAVLTYQRLRRGEYDYKTYIAIIYLTQNTNFTYGGFVYIPIIALLFVHRARRQYFDFKLLKALTLLILGFLIANIRIIFLFLMTNFTSHRTEWSSPTQGWFSAQALDQFSVEFTNAILKGEYHYASGQTGVFNLISIQTVTILSALLVVLTSIKKFSNKLGSSQPSVKICYSFLAALIAWIAICIFYASEVSGLTQFSYIAAVPFQFSRVIFVVPFIITFLFGLGMLILADQISRRFRFSTILLVIVLVALQISYSYVPFSSQIKELIGREHGPTVSEYFQEDKYKRISLLIGKNPEQIKVLSFGIDPMIASFNNFVAIDGYSYNYSVEYKHKFYEILKPVISSDPEVRDYFLGWGSRVYLFENSKSIEKYSYNWCAARELGGEFLISQSDFRFKNELIEIGRVDDLVVYELPLCSSSSNLSGKYN